MDEKMCMNCKVFVRLPLNMFLKSPYKHPLFFQKIKKSAFKAGKDV